MTHAYALKTAKELTAIVAADPAQGPAVLAFLNEAMDAGKRRTRPSRILQAKLAGTPELPTKPTKRATARKPQPKAAPAPAASEDALQARVITALAASNEAFLASFFAK